MKYGLGIIDMNVYKVAPEHKPEIQIVRKDNFISDLRFDNDSKRIWYIRNNNYAEFIPRPHSNTIRIKPSEILMSRLINNYFVSIVKKDGVKKFEIWDIARGQQIDSDRVMNLEGDNQDPDKLLKDYDKMSYQRHTQDEFALFTNKHDTKQVIKVIKIVDTLNAKIKGGK